MYVSLTSEWADKIIMKMTRKPSVQNGQRKYNKSFRSMQHFRCNIFTHYRKHGFICFLDSKSVVLATSLGDKSIANYDSIAFSFSLSFAIS